MILPITHGKEMSVYNTKNKKVYKDCIDSVIIENKMPSRIEDLEDDASCILIHLHTP